MHFRVLEGILNFLILPFLIRVFGLFLLDFCFLFLLKALIECSWNNSHIFLLVWIMLQFLRTTAVRFGRNMLILMKYVLDLVVLDLFLAVDRLL